MPYRPPRMYSRGTRGRVSLLNVEAAEHLSTLERDLLLVLDFDARVKRVEMEAVEILYEHENRSRQYTPDLLVEFEWEGRTWVELYEVKQHEDLLAIWQEHRPRFKAAVAYCRARGWRFRLMTEKQIRVAQLENFKFLRRYRWIREDDMHEQALLLTSAVLGPSKVKDLLTATWNDQERRLQALAYVWRLLAFGELQADLTKPLTNSTSVWRSA